MHIKRIASILNLQRKSIGKSRLAADGVRRDCEDPYGPMPHGLAAVMSRRFRVASLVWPFRRFPTLANIKTTRRRAGLDRHDRDLPRRLRRSRGGLPLARDHRRPARLPVGRCDFRLQSAVVGQFSAVVGQFKVAVEFALAPGARRIIFVSCSNLTPSRSKSRRTPCGRRGIAGRSVRASKFMCGLPIPTRRRSRPKRRQPRL
jgi:hypothetical protein